MGVRLRTWLHRDDLDERIAAGEDVAGDPELEWRAQRLRSRRVRETVAHGIEMALHCAQAGNHHLDAAHLPVDRAEVMVARSDLERLADRLRQPQEAEPRGVAMARLLLAGQRSPIHGGGPRHGVQMGAQAAVEALGR